MLEINQIHHGDCLELMHEIPDGSIDMVLADLPYGTTACAWDSIIDLDLLWGHYKRVIKPRGAIVLTASQPFTTILINAAGLDWFKYDWVWIKSKPNGWQHAPNKPMKTTEDVLIFSKAPMGHSSILGENRMNYNPIGVESIGAKKISAVFHGRTMGARVNQVGNEYIAKTNYPNNVLKFANVVGTAAIHPTQKPVALFAYLIRTYTNPGDLVLDNTAGSGTTAIAAIQTGRDWLCIEKDADIYATAANRIAKALGQDFTPAARACQPNNQNQAELLQRGLWE